MRFFVASFLWAASLGAVCGQSNLNHTCQLVPQYRTCTAEANTIDSCCVEKYGLVVSSQYWFPSTDREAEGQLLPHNTWTVEGLWNLFCDKSVAYYCDLTRQYDAEPSPSPARGLDGVNRTVPTYNGTTVDNFIKAFGKYDLLDWMNTYWIAGLGTPNPYFWAHLFSKHGTCFSTFALPCYGPRYVTHEDVIDYFETAARYYLRLPTYAWLAAAGIAPSNTTTYSLDAVQAALKKGFGATPYIGCAGPPYNATAAGKGSADAGATIIDELWYYHYVHGRTQDARAVPIDTSVTGITTSCATTKGALRYLKRAPGSERKVGAGGPGLAFKGDCTL